MGTETYPKKGVRLTSDEKLTTFATGTGSVASEYSQVRSKSKYPAGKSGAVSTSVSTAKNVAPFATGGGNKMVCCTYPKKLHSKFSSEQVKNSLIAPMSRSPKQA